MEIEIKERSQWVSDVNDFLDRFHQDRQLSPGWPDDATMQLRSEMIREEYSELVEALMTRNLPDTVDAIIDLCYVLIGTLPSLGVEADPIWDAVHASNMAKVGGARRDDGKILKPEGWTPPDIRGLLNSQGVDNSMSRYMAEKLTK